MFWQRQCLNIFIKKGGRLVKGSRCVCGLTLICFDIPCSLIICRVSGLTVIHMKCRAESNRPSRLHAHSFMSPPASTQQGPPSTGATPALREHLCGTGYLRVLWAPGDNTGWTGLAHRACPLWPQGSQKTFPLISASLSPHLCKSSVYFDMLFPSCGSSHLLHIPFPFVCARMSRLSFYLWLYVLCSCR